VQVPGGFQCGGRTIRHVSGTSRPPWIWPEAWQRLGQGRRDKLFADWELIQRRLATCASQARPRSRDACSRVHTNTP
jgi:hypothetical protein